MSKYNNIKVSVDNVKFDSKREASRYLELKLLLRAKEITDLELQPAYVLLDSFSYKGDHQRAVKYIADFRYKDKAGLTHVEDAKGMRTEVYLIKRKFFLSKNKEVEFHEV